MSQPINIKRASVRAAVERSHAARLRAVERRLVARLAYLRRHGPAEFRALVALLRSVAARSGSRGSGPGASISHAAISCTEASGPS